MATRYSYKGKLWSGEEVGGQVTAQNEHEVLQNLRAREIFVTKLYPLNKNLYFLNNLSAITFVTRFDLICFTKQFASMIKSGVSVIESLETIVPQTKNGQLRSAIISIIDEIKAGNTLYESFLLHKNIFPQLLLGMIQSGEEAGNLESVLIKTADVLQKEEKFIRKIKTAFAYPIILLSMSVVVIYMLLTIVLPKFIMLFAENTVELPVLTKIVIDIGEFIGEPGLLILIVIAFIVMLFFLWYILMYTDKLDKQKLQIPMIGDLVMTAETIKFARTLALLLNSGIVLYDALHTTAVVMGNSQYAKNLIKIKSKLAKGIDLEKCLTDSELFFPMVSKLVAIGERSGSLELMLYDLAEYYEGELDTKLERLTTCIEPILILIMALIIGVIILAVVLPMVNIWQVI